MRFRRVFVIAVLLFSSLGCGDDGTGPEHDGPPPTGLKHAWSERFGDEDGQFAQAVAVDPAGNVIVAGYFFGTVDFGGGVLTSAGNCDVLVAKFDPNGAHSWSRRFGGASYQIGLDVAVDGSGEIYVIGDFDGSIDFGGGVLTSVDAQDMFIAKLGSDGAHQWSKRLGDGGFQYAEAVAVDGSGDVIMAGGFAGTADFGGGPLTSAGGDDIFVVKFGPDGVHRWSRRFGDGDSQNARAIAADKSGNLVLTGLFAHTVDFGGGVLVGSGMHDVFVVKLGSDGAHLWSQGFGDAAYQGSAALAIDGLGNVLVAGDFEGTIDFGGGERTSGGSSDIFVAKFGPDGSHLWSKRFGDGRGQWSSGLAVDVSGDVFAGGYFEGAVDFGGGEMISAGREDIFVVRFGADGSHRWSQRFGDPIFQRAEAIAIDAGGGLLLTGSIYGVVDFGGGGIPSGGGADVFVAKFVP